MAQETLSNAQHNRLVFTAHSPETLNFRPSSSRSSGSGSGSTHMASQVIVRLITSPCSISTVIVAKSRLQLDLSRLEFV